MQMYTRRVSIQTQGQPGLAAGAQMCEHCWIKRVRTCKLDFFSPTPGENDSLCSQQARRLPSVNRTILSLTEAHPCGWKSRSGLIEEHKDLQLWNPDQWVHLRTQSLKRLMKGDTLTPSRGRSARHREAFIYFFLHVNRGAVSFIFLLRALRISGIGPRACKTRGPTHSISPCAVWSLIKLKPWFPTAQGWFPPGIITLVRCVHWCVWSLVDDLSREHWSLTITDQIQFLVWMKLP